jgi:hypothetical protein
MGELASGMEEVDVPLFKVVLWPLQEIIKLRGNTAEVLKKFPVVEKLEEILVASNCNGSEKRRIKKK